MAHYVANRWAWRFVFFCSWVLILSESVMKISYIIVFLLSFCAVNIFGGRGGRGGGRGGGGRPGGGRPSGGRPGGGGSYYGGRGRGETMHFNFQK